MINREFLQDHQKIVSDLDLNYNNVGELLSVKAKENNEKVFLNSGGGIVSDSKPLNEYHELNKKVENLLEINKKSLNKFMAKNKKI